MNRAIPASGDVRAVVIAVVVVIYPFALATGLDHASARTIGSVLLALTLAVAVLGNGRAASRLLPLVLKRFGLIAVASLTATATNHPVALKLLPSLTNLWLLGTFVASLRGGPSIVEQFAVAMHDGFPDFLLPYCRKVTWAWCAFFAFNAATSALLAFVASPHAWAFYAGFLSYVLTAVLAVGEYVFHKNQFRFYEDGRLDGVWRTLWPPEGTALGRRTLAWQLARRAAAPSDGRHGGPVEAGRTGNAAMAPPREDGEAAASPAPEGQGAR